MIALLSQIVTVPAQDDGKTHIKTLKLFVQDLQTGVSNNDLFKKYLRSEGVFGNEKLEQTANSWTDLLRNSLKASTVDEIMIYKYPDHPENGRKLKSVEDPDSHVVEYGPLEFELHTKNNSVSSIDIDKLYVVRIRDERVFVLFSDGNSLVTYFGLKWGQKVELTEF